MIVTENFLCMFSHLEQFSTQIIMVREKKRNLVVKMSLSSHNIFIERNYFSEEHIETNYARTIINMPDQILIVWLQKQTHSDLFVSVCSNCQTVNGVLFALNSDTSYIYHHVYVYIEIQYRKYFLVPVVHFLFIDILLPGIKNTDTQLYITD